jgi:hypothetical protein
VVFLTLPEAAALDWLAAQAPTGTVVAASPALGLFIPVRTAARVVYGHPFETVAAAQQRQAIEDFYAGRREAAEFVSTYHIHYVVAGPRELALGAVRFPADWPLVYVQDGVTIYAP